MKQICSRKAAVNTAAITDKNSGDRYYDQKDPRPDSAAKKRAGCDNSCTLLPVGRYYGGGRFCGGFLCAGSSRHKSEKQHSCYVRRSIYGGRCQAAVSG